MNCVNLVGRLARDPEARYTSTGLAISSFTLKVSDGEDKEGKEYFNYPRVVVFGRYAEYSNNNLIKDQLVEIKGSLKTGSYKNKNGDTVYTTDVKADFIKALDQEEVVEKHEEEYVEQQAFVPEGFTAINEDIPF